MASAAAIAALSLVVINDDSDRQPVTSQGERVSLQRISLGAAEGRERHVAVATPHGVLLWGGVEESTRSSGEAFSSATKPDHDGLLLDVETGHATPVAAAPVASRVDAVGVWTGRDVVVLGGRIAGGAEGHADGARYDVSSDTWAPVPPAPNCVSVAARWSGGIAAAGGCERGDPSSYGIANLDIATWTWRMLPAPSQPVIQLAGDGERLVSLLPDGRLVELVAGSTSWQPVEPPPVATDPSSPTLLSLSDQELVVVAVATDSDDDIVTVVLRRRLDTGEWTVTTAPEADRPEETELARHGSLLWWQSLGGVAWFDLDSGRSGSMQRPALVRTGASATALPTGALLLFGGRVATGPTKSSTSAANGFLLQRP